MSKKKAAPLYQSWDEVNNAMRQIAEIDRTIQATEAELNRKIGELKAEAESVAAPLLAEKAELEKHIQAFTESRIDEFKDSKTKFLTFGEVGFRKATSIVTRNVKAIIEALKQNRMTDCIKVSESIDKEELAKYDDPSLERVGAKRKIEDKFFYKPSVERIEAP
ncbi:host-nuclease inhibitor Gam family protein [Brevibacillus agri]|uniref:host-nuclease inhibitor Gam family protein n=1 Tax=Brevibacillus agri TaxID=51101 RepID=UPI003D1D3F9B